MQRTSQRSGLKSWLAEHETRVHMQDEEKTPIKQDTKKGKLRFYPYNIKCAPCGPSDRP